MRMIRYESMIAGGSNQCSTLRLSSYESRQEKESTTEELSHNMALISDKWIIDGDEIFTQINALWELVKFLRDNNKDIFIHIKTHHYGYGFLRCASMTDEILDYCDVLTDKDENMIDLRATIMGNSVVYWEVSK